VKRIVLVAAALSLVVSVAIAQSTSITVTTSTGAPLSPGKIPVATATNKLTDGGVAVSSDPTLSANSNALLPTQSAVKTYTDNSAQGLVYKTPVQLATTANIALSGEQTIDGVLTSTSMVLVKDNTDATQNGIYVTGAGSWLRRSDANTGALLKNAAVLVSAGSTNINTTWNCSCASVTIGTTPITFVKISGSNTYTASNGVQLIGNQFSVDNTVNRNDASALASGTVAANRGGAGGVNGALKADGSGNVSQANCTSLSDAGNACSKSVGTTAGTVAAGDDSRITGAAQKSANLGDLASASAARTNLDLGTAATQSTGASGATIPLNNGNNTSSGNQTHTGAENFSNLAQSQATVFQRDNPPGSPFTAICGDLVSAEARPGNADLTVGLPPPTLNDCIVELHPFPGNIYVDPSNGGTTNGYIKSDDFDRITTLLKIPGSNGKPTFTLRNGTGGWEWRTFGVMAPPSSVWRTDLSNGQVYLDHITGNSRLCPLNGGGIRINHQTTYVPLGCAFLPDSLVSTPSTTTAVYATRLQGQIITNSSQGSPCPDSTKVCLTFPSTAITYFEPGDSITCVNFHGTPGANVYDDASAIYVDTTHIELSDVTYVGPETIIGSQIDPQCAFLGLRLHLGAISLDPIDEILVNSSLPSISYVGSVTTDASGNVVQIVSQYNAQLSLPPTAVASLPSSAVGLQQASNEGCGTALLYGDQTVFRRASDGQVATSNCGARGLLSRFHNRASAKLQGQIEQTYQYLKDSGLIVAGTCMAHCLTGLWVFALPNQNDTLSNWVSPGTCDLTVVGTPTFTANKGYTGDGSSALLNTGCLEATLGGTQDDFAVGAYVLTPSTATAGIIGQNGSAAGRRIYFSSGLSGALAANVNANSVSAYTPSRYTGMFTALRDPAAVGTLTAAVEETTTNIARVSNALPISFISFLGTNDSTGAEYSTAQIGFAFAGHLTTADLANLRAALEDYFLAQVGAITPTVANLPPPANFKGQSYFIPDLGGGPGLIQSDGAKWGRLDDGGYESRTLATGAETLTPLTNACNVEYINNLTGNTTITLSGTDARGEVVKKGMCQRITLNQAAPGAFTFTIKDGPSVGTLIVFPSATNKSAMFRFSGTNWRLMQDSAL